MRVFLGLSVLVFMGCASPSPAPAPPPVVAEPEVAEEDPYCRVDHVEGATYQVEAVEPHNCVSLHRRIRETVSSSAAACYALLACESRLMEALKQAAPAAEAQDSDAPAPGHTHE